MNGDIVVKLQKSSVLVAVFQRNRTGKLYVDIREDIYRRNWLTQLWKLGSPRSTIGKLENQ